MKKSIIKIITIIFILIMGVNIQHVYASNITKINTNIENTNKNIVEPVDIVESFESKPQSDKYTNISSEVVETISNFSKIMTFIIVIILSVMIILIVVLSSKKGKKSNDSKM